MSTTPAPACWQTTAQAGSKGKAAQSPSGLVNSASPSDPNPSVASRHLPAQRGVTPLCGAPYCAGFAREKASPHVGRWPREARPEGLYPLPFTKKLSLAFPQNPCIIKLISQSRDLRVGLGPGVPDQRGVVAGRSDGNVRGAGFASHCCMMVCNGGCGVVPIRQELPPPLCGNAQRRIFYVRTKAVRLFR